MTADKNDLLLRNLVKIEEGIAKIYEFLAAQDEYSQPVKKFWQGIAEEERLHARMFEDIRQGMVSGAVAVSVGLDIAVLENFVVKVNTMVKKAQQESLNESEAYSLGALIEAELDEGDFMRQVETDDPDFVKMLRKIERDTNKHRVMLLNYAKGIR